MEKHIVDHVLEGSIAAELDIEPGDELRSINGQVVEDVFDYHYLVNDEYLVVVVRKANGEEWELEIEKEFEDDLGIVFKNSLMDDYRSCRNNCIFCFIDQMPPGMRETLYFKDDDSRLSFLQGNYVTLTNMSDHDIDRIIHYHLAPINVSVHTTNPELRRRMLHNRFAGDVFGKIRRLAEAGIEMNGQIVLCRHYNDGPELERTLHDLEEYMPAMQSVSVVPVGLTKFREHLCPLEAFDAQSAAETIDLIEGWQQHFLNKFGTRGVYASDEWYLLAGRELPPAENYDGYLQLENGVGMLRLLREEVAARLEIYKGRETSGKLTIATGRLAAPSLKKIAEEIVMTCPGMEIQVIPIVNHFFGEQITVSGLITGADLRAQLKDRDLGERLLIPCNMLRSGENVFLDDYTVEELEKELKIPVTVVDPGGDALVDTIVTGKDIDKHKRRQIYEQADCSNCGPSECR